MGYSSIIKRQSPSLFLSLFLALLFTTSAHAAAVIKLDKRLTWDLVGLDSNDLLSGPDTFPVGYRYCNTGDTVATNVVGTFSWDSVNSYINLETGTSATISLDELGVGVCYDFYFNIQIARNDLARGTARGYHIGVTADGITSVDTPIHPESYNQIFIESLVSQNRNQTNAIIGPTTVYQGETYQYILYGSTATNGYEQLEAYINFPNNIFRIISVDATYTAPPAGINDAVYADACGWVHDPTDPNYNTCTGTDKMGGDIIFTYEVEIIGTGSATVSAMIYDQSGSSYHYNSDFGIEEISITALPSPNPALTIDKIITAGNPYAAVGDTIDYSYLITNTGNILLAGPVTVADDKTTATCPAVKTVGNLDSNLDPGESITCTASYTVVQADLNSGRVTNVASASADGTSSPTDTETATSSKKFPWPTFMRVILPPPCPDEPLYCYTVSDRDNETSEDEGSTNSALLKYTFTDSRLELVGRLGVGSVEAMTLSLDGTTLYAVDSHMFGTIDTTPGNTSSFTPVNPYGLGTGNGALGKVSFTDIDGISFDPTTGILYGTNRLVTSDLLLQINPATGTCVKNAFGLGVDYVIIGSNAEAAEWFDLDDIGIDKNGTMYGIANAQGFDDRLVIIDKKTGNITNPVLMIADEVPLNDVEGFSYFSKDTFYGATGVETIAEQGSHKNSLFKIEMNPVRVEKIINLDQDFNGYRPYDFEALACRMCVPGKSTP